MDGMPFIVPGSLQDFLRQEAALHKRRQTRGRGARRKPPRPATPAEGGRVPLADGLFFRILPTAKSGGFAAQAAAIAETFRLAFLGVWQQVRGQDRERLRDYWRGQPDRLLEASPFALRYASPRIRIVTGVPWSPADFLSDNLGTEFTFPLGLVTEHPDELPHAIARGLAEGHLYASRRHWGVALELIEEPLARWEKRMGKKLNDETRDAKIDQLEAAHRRAYEKEIMATLTAWGFEPSATPRRR
jgi:hypothetical protein